MIDESRLVRTPKFLFKPTKVAIGISSNGVPYMWTLCWLTRVENVSIIKGEKIKHLYYRKIE